jgi:hypothetical protein
MSRSKSGGITIAAFAPPRPMTASISRRSATVPARSKLPVLIMAWTKRRLSATAIRPAPGRQVAHLGLDRVAEHRQLDGGNPHHHAEHELVAPHLDELLPEHRPEGPAPDPSDRLMPPRLHRARCISMKTSSIVATPESGGDLARSPHPDQVAAREKRQAIHRSASSI